MPVLRRALALAGALAGALAAHAAVPPLDPWADDEWQDVMHGLPQGRVVRLQATQQLLDIHAGSGAVLSERSVEMVFEAPGGRVARLVVDDERRGESRSRRAFRYVYEGSLLRRIDEDGQAEPALARRYDAAGRPLEQTERTGAVVARTAWRYDAQGRLRERTFDSGAGARSKETRAYRRDGTLERLVVDGGVLTGRRIDFDALERPVRIRVTDTFDRHETAITYPVPTEAVHETTGFALTRDGAGRYTYSTRYRVRTPEELRSAEPPQRPTWRRHARGTLHEEVQTEYDDAGRVRVERRFDADGQLVCVGRIDYHPSGPPIAVRNERARPGAPCETGDLDNEVRTDEQGRWIEQRMSIVRPDGARRPMSIQTRRVEDRQ